MNRKAGRTGDLVVKIAGNFYRTIERNTMSAPAPHTPDHEVDAVEAVVPLMPIVLPIVGGVLMLLLAFIAVSMA